MSTQESLMVNVNYSFIQSSPEVETNVPQQVKADLEEYIHTLEWREKASGPCNRVGEPRHPGCIAGGARHRLLLQGLILCRIHLSKKKRIHLSETGSLVGCLGWEDWLRKDRWDFAGDKCSMVTGVVVDTGLYTVLKTLKLLVFLKDFWCWPFLKSLLNLLQYCFCFLCSWVFWPGVTWNFSSIRDQTCNSCIDRQILYHRATTVALLCQ